MSVRARCDKCGDVSIANSDLQLRKCIDTGHATYLFRCPSCQMVVVAEAHPRIVDLLINCGVDITPWFLPAEMFEKHDGPPISVDDVIDFHEAMNL